MLPPDWPFLLSTAFLGQALSRLYSTQESCFMLLIPSSVPLIFLSGFVWLYKVIPQLLKLLARLVPSTSMMRGLVRLNQMDTSFFQVKNDCLILWGLCGLYFTLAVLAQSTTKKSR
ncbi:MAG: ABC transporter permease [Alphaproteobacteria bacterium]|nr:ABC transporter permease [Alphaproteobacteria bacterium]